MVRCWALGVEEGFVSELSNMVGCKVGEWPTKYLGMPLGGNLRYVDFWEPVADKVAQRLDGWKKTFLSNRGRLTLIESSYPNLLPFIILDS